MEEALAGPGDRGRRHGRDRPAARRRPLGAGGPLLAAVVTAVAVLATGCAEGDVAGGEAGTGAAGGQGQVPPAAAEVGLPEQLDPGALAAVPRSLADWPARGSLAGDGAVASASAALWRDGSSKVPFDGDPRVLFAGRVGGTVAVVLHGVTAEAERVALVAGPSTDELRLVEQVGIVWKPTRQVSFWLPEGAEPWPGAPAQPGDQAGDLGPGDRLPSERAGLLVLPPPGADAVAWLRSTPEAPEVGAVPLEPVDGAWHVRFDDAGDLVGVEIRSGGKLVWAGLPGGDFAGFGMDSGNGLTFTGPSWVLGEVGGAGDRWQLLARPSLTRPTGETSCVTVRVPLAVTIAGTSETCGVDANDATPLSLGGANLEFDKGPLVAWAAAAPAAERVSLLVDGRQVEALVRRVPVSGVVVAAVVIPAGFQRVEAVAYGGDGQELARLAREATDGFPSGEPGTPAYVTARETLPACGSYQLDVGWTLDPAARAAQACFWDALQARRGAELQVTAPTDEGDPIVTLYRALPGGDEVEVLIDATKDRYGGARWTRMVCASGPRNERLELPSCRAG